MWVFLSLCSALCLGGYEFFKKLSLKGNSVTTILYLNIFFYVVLTAPFSVASHYNLLSPESFLYVPSIPWQAHLLISVKSIVLIFAWWLALAGAKGLPVSVFGMILVLKPVMTMSLAMLVYGERLNLYQWLGTIVLLVAFFFLGRTGKKEGIQFFHSKAVYCTLLSIFFNSLSGLYDKYLLGTKNGLALHHMDVQVWFPVYQLLILTLIFGCVWLKRRPVQIKITWQPAIVLAPLAVVCADLFYFYAITLPNALLAVIVMLRSARVLVVVFCGWLFLHEGNMRSKAKIMLLVLIGLWCLAYGSN